MGNFPEIDAYIIIACPYYTFYDLKDFYKVVINPFELEFAIAGTSWKNYVLSDLNNIIKEDLPNNERTQDIMEESKNDSKHDQNEQLAKMLGNTRSLVNINSQNQGQLVKLDFLKSLDFHQDRLYKGLDVNTGKFYLIL